MTKAYSYLRFSTLEQRKGDSSRRQSTLATEYARKHGLDLDTSLTFQDLGVSAFRSKNAKTGALRAFLDAVEAGEIAKGSYLLVESLDRISRDDILSAQALFMQIVQAGIALVTLNDEKFYSAATIIANPFDLILSIVSLIRANEESATKARRLGASWHAKRGNAATKPLTSICPAWLRLDAEAGKFEILPERVAIVRRIFDEALGGKGKHSVAESLNRDGIDVFGHHGRKGKHWHRSYVAKILDNPAVVGTMTPHRIDHTDGMKRRVPLEPVLNYYPPIIEADAFERIQMMSAGTRHPLRGRHASGSVSNILGGLAHCPRCDGTMTLVNKGPTGGARYLVCTKAKAGAGCEYRAVRYQDVERAIIEDAQQIVEEAPSSNAEANRLRELIDTTGARIDHATDELDALLDTASHRPGPALANRIAATEEKLRVLRVEFADLEARLSGLVPARWKARLDDFLSASQAEPLDRRSLNAALRVLLIGVVVNYEATILWFKWKHGGESVVHYRNSNPRLAGERQRRGIIGERSAAYLPD